MPTTSIGAVVIVLGIAFGVFLGTGGIPMPVEDKREAPAEPGITNIGGDEPPMEFTPSVGSSSRRAPTSSVRPSAPPVYSKPVVTPAETPSPEISIVRTTAVPLPELPSLSSSVMPASSTTESSRSDVGA